MKKMLGYVGMGAVLAAVLLALLSHFGIWATPDFMKVALAIAGVYIGFINISKAEQWKERNLRLLHLIAGVILVAFGVWVFLS